MSWIAAGVTVAGAVAGGISQYSAASGLKSDSQAATGQLNSALGGIGPVDFQGWNLAPLSKGFDEYLGQAAYLKKLTNFASKQNDAWQGILDKASPGLNNTVKAAGRVINDWVHGEATAGEEANVTRSAAFKALAGGFGANSSAGRALEARDIRESTVERQTRGISLLPQQLQTANFLSPVAPHNLLLTPGQIITRIDTNDQFNTQVENSELAFNTNLALQKASMAYSGAMTQAGLNYQASSAQGQAIQGAIQGVGSAFGGMSFGTATPAAPSAPATNSGGFYGSFGAAQQAYGSGANIAWHGGSSPNTSGYYNLGYY